MPRQVMSPIDLRSQAERQGITKTQQTAQAIASILQTVGAAEQKRRERQTLDRITRAISGGATIPEAIMASKQEPEFGKGISGALQKFGGMFQPSPGDMGQSIQQAIIGQALTRPEPFTLTPGAERFTGAGKRIAGVEPEPISPTQQIASRKLAKINQLQKKVEVGTATPGEKAMLEKMLAGQPMVQIGPSLLTPEQRKAEAEAEHKKKLAQKRLTPTDLKSIRDTVKEIMGESKALPFGSKPGYALKQGEMNAKWESVMESTGYSALDKVAQKQIENEFDRYVQMLNKGKGAGVLAKQYQWDRRIYNKTLQQTDVIQTPTKEMFLKNVEDLKAAGSIKEAKAYYDKWVNKIQW